MTYEPRTYEELIMGLITKAFEAMNSDDSSLFDGVLDSIEILLKIVPPMHNDFMTAKMQLYEMAKNNFIETEKRISTYNDELLKDFVKRKEEGEISWAYRKDILETVLSVLGKYNKIAYTNQDFATISDIGQITAKEVQPIQPKPQYQDIPKIEEHHQAETQQSTPQQVSEQQLRELLMKNQEQKTQNQSKHSGFIFGRK